MAKRKEERNRQFWRDWKEKGLSNKELSIKYGLTLESVSSFKKVLKLRYEKGEEIEQSKRRKKCWLKNKKNMIDSELQN